MTKVYIRNANRQKIEIEVSEEIAGAMKECRRQEWRNDAKERYHRGRTLSTLPDNAIEFKQDKPERNLMVASPEELTIAAEERTELQLGLSETLETLTARQKQVLTLLHKGHSVTEIATLLGVTKQSINDIRKAIQNKFKTFLK